MVRVCHVHVDKLLINIVNLSISKVCSNLISRSTMSWSSEHIGWNLARISSMGETFCSNYSNCPIVDGVVMSTKATMLDFPIELIKKIK